MKVKMIEFNHKNVDTLGKEETDMAAMAKPNEANIIRDGMFAAFANEVKKSIPDKSYWDECRKSQNVFSSEDIENMKEMCKGQKK